MNNKLYALYFLNIMATRNYSEAMQESANPESLLYFSVEFIFTTIR